MPENRKGESHDPTLAEKVAHVRAAKQTRDHGCHWPGCPERVPPAKWGCIRHWRKIPLYLRRKIWDAYRPGQETTMTPSREYVAAAREVRRWIEEHYPTE
jgi:hypothetical protein